MGKTALSKCKEFITFLTTKGYNNEVDINNLTKCIKSFFGGDIRTIQKYLELLREFEFLEKIRENIFKIKGVETK